MAAITQLDIATERAKMVSLATIAIQRVQLTVTVGVTEKRAAVHFAKTPFMV